LQANVSNYIFQHVTNNILTNALVSNSIHQKNVFIFRLHTTAHRTRQTDHNSKYQQSYPVAKNPPAMQQVAHVTAGPFQPAMVLLSDHPAVYCLLRPCGGSLIATMPVDLKARQIMFNTWCLAVLPRANHGVQTPGHQQGRHTDTHTRTVKSFWRLSSRSVLLQYTIL